MTITIIHDYKRVIEIKGVVNTIVFDNMSIAQVMILLAKKYPDALLVWCHQNLSTALNNTALAHVFKNERVMASFTNDGNFYLPSALGYVDQTSFFKANLDKPYPTFLMSGDVGGIYGRTLLKFEHLIDNDFSYTLNSIAKIGQPQGLFCYTHPNLLTHQNTLVSSQATTATLFKFVRQHYKSKWTFILFLSFLLFERSFALFPAIWTILKFKKVKSKVDLQSISAHIKTTQDYKDQTIGVIIPTIGRKAYLYNVLKDLTKQSKLPSQVIIVEQHPDKSQSSELDYLTTEKWPFNIKHHFTHNTGACGARNIGLSLVSSNVVFFADDDIRLTHNLLEDALHKMSLLDCKALTLACLTANETEPITMVKQWESFGAGCSFVDSTILENVTFDMAFENGYAEDKDFGMQLRNDGNDIFYDPNIVITHLKAPSGGFRFQPMYPWQDEKYSPKPSPTIMLHSLKNKTRQQFLGFKLVYFLQRLSGWRSILRINSIFKEWNCSLKWATHLKYD